MYKRFGARKSSIKIGVEMQSYRERGVSRFLATDSRVSLRSGIEQSQTKLLSNVTGPALEAKKLPWELALGISLKLCSPPLKLVQTEAMASIFAYRTAWAGFFACRNTFCVHTSQLLTF